MFAALSASFFFVNATTFTSLGVALYAMTADLHWSQTAAGFSFTALGLACGLASPLPMLVVLRAGGRVTLGLGGLFLAAGFGFASVGTSLASFYGAMLLVGLGYAFAGNIAAIFLLSNWFPNRPARAIGLYMMSGALGSTVGPPLVNLLIEACGGWRALWRVLAVAALGLALFCLLTIRDAAAALDDRVETSSAGARTLFQAVATPAFLLVAASLTMTMTAITTIDSIAMPFLAAFGTSPAVVPFVLSTLALVDALTRGVAGGLSERIAPARLLAGGLLLQGIGSLALIGSTTPPLQYGAATLDGLGCGLTYVASNVVLLQVFGRRVGSELLSIAWLVSTLAAAGPLAAGIIADHAGTFSPILLFYGILFVALVIPACRLNSRRSTRRVPALS
ncbi:MAG: MFS transporter [Janthinobacterium lividum]